MKAELEAIVKNQTTASATFFGRKTLLPLGLRMSRRLGIFKPHEEKAKKAREKEPGERFWIEVLGRPVPATNTDDGIRAVRGRNPVGPDSVRRYLEDKFGEDLKAVRSAM